jgi:hypothetical protein
VIAVAQRLARENIKVRVMVLFDAVDRAIGIDTTEIPATSNASYTPAATRTHLAATASATAERNGTLRPSTS